MKDIDTNRTYCQIAKAIEYFRQYQQRQPSLSDLSHYVGLSEFHLQRLFSEWVGVSPKQYLQYLTKENAKQRLRESTVLDSALSAGLSGTSRLHDLMVTCEGMTPGEYKRYGKGLRIDYGLHSTPFGQCLLAITERGVCKLAFFDSDDNQQALENELLVEWSEADIVRDEEKTAPVVQNIFPSIDVNCGGSNHRSDTVATYTVSTDNKKPLNLLLKGSKFQLKVWEALLAIPDGEVFSYQQVATLIDAPSSVRAVASAIAKNNIGYLIPCHRVIRSNGEFSNYRWGGERKQAIIGWEACRVQAK